jgi:hypothetical protein
MLFARSPLKSLQRQSGILLGSTLLLTMFLFAVAYDAPEHFNVPHPLLLLLRLLPAFPVAAMVYIIGRYLARETDEFIRAIVTRAILWGLGVTMVANIVLNVLFSGGSAYGPSQIFGIDIFFATACLALLAQLKRNQ